MSVRVRDKAESSFFLNRNLPMVQIFDSCGINVILQWNCYKLPVKEWGYHAITALVSFSTRIPDLRRLQMCDLYQVECHVVCEHLGRPVQISVEGYINPVRLLKCCHGRHIRPWYMADVYKVICSVFYLLIIAWFFQDTSR